MYLGDLRIASEEVERITWEDGELTMDVRWSLEEVPVLFDLSQESLLRWHQDDPEAGIPVKIRQWRHDPAAAQLNLTLRLNPDGATPTTG